MATTTILSLSDAQIHLGVADPALAAELQAVVNAAASWVEGVVGPIDPASHTRVVEGSGDEALVLPHTQVTAIVSVAFVESGASPSVDISGANLVLDATTGVAYLKSGGWPDEELLVTYTVGRSPVPDWAREACKYRAQALWSAKRGSGRPGKGGNDPAFLLKLAEETLAPHATHLGFA